MLWQLKARHFLKPALLVAATIGLGAQTSLTSDSNVVRSPAEGRSAPLEQPVGFPSKQTKGNVFNSPFIDPKAIMKDRCDETPKPKDCNVKF